MFLVFSVKKMFGLPLFGFTYVYNGFQRYFPMFFRTLQININLAYLFQQMLVQVLKRFRSVLIVKFWANVGTIVFLLFSNAFIENKP
jgi:hypothetical protein